MPCYVDSAHEHASQIRELKSQVRELENKSNFHEAIACMLMRFLKSDCAYSDRFLCQMLNYAEAGISQQQFSEWWETHQVKDQARLKAEMISNLKTNIESLSVDQLAKMVAILKNS